MLTDQPAYYYAHIPKTGGTSFTALLDRFFAVNEVFSAKVWPHVDIAHNPANSYCRLYRGHFGGGGIKGLTARECEMITILRRPCELVQSTYQFVRRRENILNHKLMNETKMSLSDYLQDPRTQFLSENRMTRFLSFDFQSDPSVQGVFLNQAAINRVLPFLNKNHTEITIDQRCERAWGKVKNSVWFGILERFDDSLRLLCFLMKWPPVRQIQRLNQSTLNNKVTLAEHTLIEELNQSDNLLYNKALALFDERYETMREKLTKYQTKSSQTLDDLLDLYYQSEGENKCQKSIDYTFEQPLKGCGWHRRQNIHHAEGYCRWSGPETISGIDFWLIPNEYELEIDVIHAISPEVLDGLILSVNGFTLEWNANTRSVKRTIKAVASKEMIQPNGLTRLELQLSATKPFYELAYSNDERMVGIALTGIRFKNLT